MKNTKSMLVRLWETLSLKGRGPGVSGLQTALGAVDGWSISHFTGTCSQGSKMPRPLPCHSGSSPVSNYYSQQQFSLSFIHCKIFHLHAHVYSHTYAHTHMQHSYMYIYTSRIPAVQAKAKFEKWDSKVSHLNNWGDFMFLLGFIQNWAPLNSGSESECVYWDGFLRQETPPGAWEASLSLLLTPPNTSNA